jgi:hypothetical protein
MQKLATIEEKVFSDTKTRLDSWQKSSPWVDDIKGFYLWLDDMIAEAYLRLFGL